MRYRRTFPSFSAVAAVAAVMLLAVWNCRADRRPMAEKSPVRGTEQTSDICSTNENIHVGDEYERYAIRWFNNQSGEETKGVALVIHGLNLRPDKMQTIISVLAGSGIDVLRLSLRGHGENYSHHPGIDEEHARLQAFKDVSFSLWRDEAYLAYTQIRQKAAEKKVPLFFVGFSLGGLVGLDLFASRSDVQYDRVILFAPAIKLHPLHYLARILAPMSRLVIPSMAPDSYLSNKKGTPMAAYNALFEGLKHFEKHMNQRLNVPTLIFIDEDDEFIPVRAIEKMQNKMQLNQWKLYIVEKDATANRDSFHHHIIDEFSTGKAVWEKMMATATTFLLATSPNE